MSIWFQVLIFGITGLLIYLCVFYDVPGLANKCCLRFTDENSLRMYIVFGVSAEKGS